jgi:uracil-DNA glycosylase family 4
MTGNPGLELDETYLRLAGLDRSDVHVTLMVQCRHEKQGQDYPAPARVIESCSRNHIPADVEAVSPEIIILLGAMACSLLDGTSDEVDLELEHGRPRPVSRSLPLGGWSGTIVPMYHPAAGMRDGKWMIYELEDWEKLGMWLRGKYKYPSTLTVKPCYHLISHVDEFWSLVNAEPEVYEYLPVDTESDEGRIWSVQFSTQPGKGFMFLTENKEITEAFDCWLQWTNEGKVMMHFAIHDLDELDQIGVHVSSHRCTMTECYHLGNIPQGLKSAVYRVFGHRMVSYRETVIPHSLAVLDEWLCEALMWAVDQRIVEPHPIGVGCPTCGKKHRKDVSVYKPHAAEAVLRRIHARVQARDADYDPWEKPKLSHGEEKPRLIGREWLAAMEQGIGRLPRQSIVHVPLKDAVRYGCSDADWTGRLGTWLEQERKRIVTQEWRVA